MLDSYLMVSKEVLPSVFSKVLQVKEMMNSGEYEQVSEAVKKVGLSRSTYYKYKDYIFRVEGDTLKRKALISLLLNDEKGLLSEVLNVISNSGCNIITINQNIPIQSKANVVISFSTEGMNVQIEELLNSLMDLKNVTKAKLISIE